MIHGGAHGPEDGAAISFRFRLGEGQVVQQCSAATCAGRESEPAILPHGLVQECMARLDRELEWDTIRDLVQTPGPEPIGQPPSL
jgi:hypothetical protein